MDTFINLAKQGYETYSESQSQSQSQSVHKTGGREYNSPDNRPSQAFRTEYNTEEVSQHVDSENHGFLDKALSHAHRTVQQQGDIDEDGVQNLKNAHHQAFSSEGQGPGGMAPDALGGAAAFKVFTDMMKGGGGSSGGSGGDMQSKLIGMAMQHASTLFDQSGGGSGADKQSAMNSAATYVMQLMMKKEMSNFVGGSSSGGLGSLMGMASKFM
ncbi:hypothetical protein DFH29DRAFT_895965 [Suillus ampliporus]|nr:hypothetical protein DFH29DRAFT_895965 [Suillus ampliporus]